MEVITKNTLWLWLTVCHGIDDPFIDGLPIKNGDFPKQNVGLPEGKAIGSTIPNCTMFMHGINYVKHLF